jgi:hypothetical protein
MGRITPNIAKPTKTIPIVLNIKILAFLLVKPVKNKLNSP